jgi:hypothetical protein
MDFFKMAESRETTSVCVHYMLLLLLLLSVMDDEDVKDTTGLSR